MAWDKDSTLCRELQRENSAKAKLTDVFKEADADKDGKLTYEEFQWKTRMGKRGKRLFEECDTDKNGSLDTTEFVTGMAAIMKENEMRSCTCSQKYPVRALSCQCVCLRRIPLLCTHSRTRE
jgi:hypothetical protein